MEQMNKLLILLVGIAFGTIMYIVTIDNKMAESIAGSVSENISKNMSENIAKAAENIAKATENKNVITTPHPYNECIKLLIDQVNKENKESDFDKMKAVCFVLSDKEKN